MTSSGADPYKTIKVQEKTVKELRVFRGDHRSLNAVILWLVDFYYTESGERRPMI